MMHTRGFIDYHGDRFADRSMAVVDDGGHMVGVFPAAQDPAAQQTLTSHPGLSYGGVVHDGSLRGESMITAIGDLAARYLDLGFMTIRYKSIPAIYHVEPADDDAYALFRFGAVLYRRDLSATIDLANRGRVSPRRRRSRLKAERAGLKLRESWADADEYWQILTSNLERRHGVAPVHSRAEIELLHSRFPGEITLITAEHQGDLIGGAVFFASRSVLHMQYSATTEAGRSLSATDLVMERGISMAAERGLRYFDFGVSMLSGGRGLDDQLYAFKIAFGAGGQAQDYYELDLRLAAGRAGIASNLASA
jgi:Acetyltransferase (GNAT) domain